jgi:hypothetical protein
MKVKPGNDCFNCPYRANVPGSAHSACNHQVIKPGVVTAMGLIGNPTALEPYIKINPIGIRGGWAIYPINFDPTWITCTLNIEP